MVTWIWETWEGVTMTKGLGVVGVENLAFRRESSKTDEYEELF